MIARTAAPPVGFRRTRARWPLPLLLLALAGEVATLAFGLRHDWLQPLIRTASVAVGCFAVAIFALSRLRVDQTRLGPRRMLLFILAGGALLQVVAATTTPTTSDDDNRYSWDAKVQLAGIDPYRYPPSAPELDRLRGDTLFFSSSGHCAWRLPDGRCSLVNRPDVRTIYPPVAEGAFTTVRVLSLGRSDGPFPLQVAGAIGVLALAGLLARRALSVGMPPWTVALWAWCPVTAVELSNNAHIDWLGALASAAALIVYRRGRSGLGGLLLGAAIATKLYPGLLLPAMLRRHPVRVVGAAASVVVLSYLPHVAAVGSQVIGYLPGYLKEEDYTNGGRFLLLALVFPRAALTAIAAAILLAAALWAARRSDPDSPERFALVLVGVAMLVATPSYSWYSVLLLALVAMTGYLEWLPLVIAPTIAALGAQYFGNGIDYRTGCYAVALMAALGGLLIRHRRAPLPATEKLA